MRSPSIFNDVIGPVMRGPSSSHCAAAVRIGRLAHDLMGGQIAAVTVRFDPQGSLATTHTSQGSDMGLFGGLLGWEPTDARLVDSRAALQASGADLRIEIAPLPYDHPNTYHLELRGPDRSHSLTALSTGGGMIEVVAIDGLSLSLDGGLHETLVIGTGVPPAIARGNLLRDGDRWQLEIPSDHALSDDELASFDLPCDVEIARLRPVLPILSSGDDLAPYTTCAEMLASADPKTPLWRHALRYEAARGAISEERVLQMMGEIVSLLREALRQGLSGTQYTDRILGYQSGRLLERETHGALLPDTLLNRMIAYVAALMEVKSSMGVIVAAPTAGACAGLPGACLAAADVMGLDDGDVAKALLAGGVIGVFIAARSTFAAEVCGCQAECGAGSGMAAAALATMAGGSTHQAVAAASLALQNILGMICDPVANRVEVPCLGRNVLAASNALACANMALADFDAVVPLDEVIATMDAVGKALPRELRCTALGGLSVTPTSQAIEKRLADNNQDTSQEARCSF